MNIINRGMDFSADRETLYRIIYRSRLLTRVLAPIMKFEARTPEELYLNAKRFDWTHVLNLDQTFAVMANVSHSQIDHSQFAALKVKDSVVDMFKKRYKGKRPNVNTTEPDLWIAPARSRQPGHPEHRLLGGLVAQAGVSPAGGGRSHDGNPGRGHPGCGRLGRQDPHLRSHVRLGHPCWPRPG